MKATGAGRGGRGRGRSGRSSGSSSGHLDNILQSPYAFTEGDLVCAFDSNECSEEDMVVLREEDRYEKDCKKNKTKKKNELFFTNGSQGTAGSGKKRRSLEISLSIRGDFDYSDDESEDDSILEL